MSYKIKVLHKLDLEVKNSWEEFESKSYNYCFQNYEWFETWFNKFRINNKNYSLRLVIVSLDSKLLCILPFEIKNLYSLKILQWAGGKHADYCAPILANDFSVNKKDFIILWKKIMKLFPEIDLVYFRKQPEYVEKIKNPFVEFLNNHKDSITYSVLLPKTWEEYTRGVLNKNFLTQNLRKERLLKNLGNVSFKIITDRIETKNLIEELIRQKNIRLKSQGIQNLFRPEDVNFYNSFENNNSKKIKIHLCSLTLNDELIAIHWGVIYKNRFYYLLLAMKEESFSKYSPGRLLISSMIKWCIENKIQIFDFTLGSEKYKKSWSNDKSILFNYLKLNNVKGFIFYLMIKIKLILKSFKENR